jgi:hypothetical protein
MARLSGLRPCSRPMSSWPTTQTRLTACLSGRLRTVPSDVGHQALWRPAPAACWRADPPAPPSQARDERTSPHCTRGRYGGVGSDCGQCCSYTPLHLRKPRLMNLGELGTRDGRDHACLKLPRIQPRRRLLGLRFEDCVHWNLAPSLDLRFCGISHRLCVSYLRTLTIPLVLPSFSDAASWAEPVGRQIQ